MLTKTNQMELTEFLEEAKQVIISKHKEALKPLNLDLEKDFSIHCDIHRIDPEFAITFIRGYYKFKITFIKESVRDLPYPLIKIEFQDVIHHTDLDHMIEISRLRKR